MCKKARDNVYVFITFLQCFLFTFGRSSTIHKNWQVLPALLPLFTRDERHFNRRMPENILMQHWRHIYPMNE